MRKTISLFTAFACMVTTAVAHDVVLRDQGKAVLGISYPSDWKQVIGKDHIVATSDDGQAWSVISTLNEVDDKAAGIQKIKDGLEAYLKEIEYDETIETESGSLILAGTGKGKKSGVEVVFTSAVFLSGPTHCGIVFIVDADIEQYYEKTVLAICESILVEEDFAEEAIDRDDKGDDNLGALYDQLWLVEDIGGQGVVDKAQTTMEFGEDGTVAGDTSVNRYRGSVSIDGSKLSFGPLAATRRAGPPALMDQESKFLKAAGTVKSFKIESTGLLSLLNEAGETVLRLSPMEVDETK